MFLFDSRLVVDLTLMKWLGALFLLVLTGTGGADLPPPERSYKILMLLPVGSKSHRNVFMPLVEALADRGHKVDMLTSYDIQHQNPNIREITHGLPHYPRATINMFNDAQTAFGVVLTFKDQLSKMARDIYQVPRVKELYRKRKEYDLIVLNHNYNEFMYPFVHEMLFITIASAGMDPRQSATLGNVLSPAYMPTLFYEANCEHVFGRFANTVTSIAKPFYWRNWEVIPAVQKEINVHFPDLPPLLELERNQSLVLMNSHFSTDLTVPLLPFQVEVGGMHCRPAKPLPEDLRSWIEGAGSAGVIYFSLGSITKGTTLPTKYRNMFIKAFSKLNQRILWKFETDLEGIPENVMIKPWLPQQDILGHPNVKVFISHGGRLSMQESLYHGTPMVTLPLFGDQPINGARVIANGWGLSLNYEDLSVELIISSLEEVTNNATYVENVVKTSRLYKDQLTSPVERAVFWTEYVIRHRGALKLRSPAASLSWVQLLLLDVLALFLLVIILSLIVLHWIFKTVVRAVFGIQYLKKKFE
ncbi:UDP-glycosyltransferase UGT5-like isoform X2 [Macrobrachium nipponense]|uniref:UDP-glycosyltransferase UGT5-like isoform X2 n=1 Tax=Macrobrachium nipponense TaxID=159736 RepID=UPI0030C7EA76